MNDKEIDAMISRVTQEAVNEATEIIDNTKCKIVIDNPKQRATHNNPSKKPISNQYYKHKFVGLSDKAEDCLKKARKLKQVPYTDKRWQDVYKNWLLATDFKFKDQGEGYEELRTMAAYHERITKNKSDIIKKSYETRMPGFNSLDEYAVHEIKRRTDIEYV